MARFISSCRRSLLSSSKTLIHPLRQHQHQSLSRQTNRPISNFLAAQIRTFTSETPQKSPFESNILRILRNEIEYQCEYAPPHQPVTEFNAFTVEDHPGDESDDGNGENVRLHINLLVDLSKGEGCDLLEFVCSAWPDCLEIQKVYLFSRDSALPQSYMGPNFRDLDKKLQSALFEFLMERGPQFSDLVQRSDELKEGFIDGFISKFEVKHFNGNGSFNMWRRRVKYLLVQQELVISGRGRGFDKGSGNSRGRSKSKGKGKQECYMCKEYDHFEKEYPQLADNGNSTAVLDSGVWIGEQASVCYWKDLFDTFHEMRGSVASLCDGSTYDITVSFPQQIMPSFFGIKATLVESYDFAR
ncbi:hypothetical protein F0562_012343 [Nyssa sinensis]|uniref:Uncharacterized protein n=1 Tax=Nyssa sinensis TaxID=561372 RepID=A0A5J4ZX94_9ASTE|nr:hypothetical protein F0562_012343 [Nyssa sinensis]